jgi:hypothetical protein
MTYKKIAFDQKEYGIPGTHTSSRWYYTADVRSTKYKEWLDDLKQFINDVTIGNPVYVEYKSNNSAGRSGTIAKVIGITNKYIEEDDIKNNFQMYIDSTYRFKGLQLTVKFDDRKNKLKPIIEDIVWLKDYTGPTVWNHNPPPPKPKPELKPIYDRLGREVKLGDFVSYAVTWYNTSRLDVYFGSVTRISDRNVVYCTNIKLNDNDRVFEERIKDNSSIVLITKDLIDQLMIKRLSSE